MDGTESRLGFRSKLVLMKLGFDLRQTYAEAAEAPLSPRLQSLVDQLMGYATWREIAPAEASEDR